MKDKILLFIILFLTVIILGAIPKKITDKKNQERLSEQEQTEENSKLEEKETWNQSSNKYKRKKGEAQLSSSLEAELEYLMVLENELRLYDKEASESELVTSSQNKDEQDTRAQDYKGIGKKKQHAYESKYPDLYAENIVPLEIDKNCKTAFLTFDDGPSQNTEKILEVLDEYQIKASFFVVASNMTETGEEALKKMAEEGHVIGIHSYCHKANVIYRNVDSFLDDFYLAYSKINEITETDICTYRFPWGSYNGYLKPIKAEVIQEMERRGFSHIDWNVSGEDSVGCPTKYSILKSIKRDVDRYSYPVILLHDSPGNELTVKVLPDIIEMLKSKGYEFGTIYERTAYQFTW